MINREIPSKNYVKYGLIIVFTLLICTISFIIYNNNKEYDKDSSVLRNKVLEIEVNDIDAYINENENVLLYFGVVNDENSKEIEDEMLKMVEKDKANFIYVNITDLKNKKDYLKEFSKKYSKTRVIDNYPAFVYIKDKEIFDVVQRDDRYLKIEDVKSFIEINEIKGEKDA